MTPAPDPDPWQTRSPCIEIEGQLTAMRCGNCLWFYPAGNGGRCHRNPPQVIYSAMGQGWNDVPRILSVWPSVDANDSCGDWQLLRNLSEG